MKKLILLLLFIPLVSFGQDDTSIKFSSEQGMREYFDVNNSEGIEGIWQTSGGTSYKILIVKNGFKYFGTIVDDKVGRFRKGDLKVTLEPAATDEIVTIKWIMGDKKSIVSTVGFVTNNALIKYNLNGTIDYTLYRVYPKLVSKSKKKRVKTGEWAGNGSGVIISKSGYVITNHHVIEDADDIEVEFLSLIHI